MACPDCPLTKKPSERRSQGLVELSTMSNRCTCSINALYTLIFMPSSEVAQGKESEALIELRQVVQECCATARFALYL